jgi:hypothetical protein
MIYKNFRQTYSMSTEGEVSKRLKHNKSDFSVTQFQKEVLAGLMFSDGSIRNPHKNKRSTGNCRFECTFKCSSIEYCKWVKLDLLGTLCTTSLPTPYPKQNPDQY